MHTEFDPTPRHRRSIRLKEYNYNHAGAYFVTICTQNRECLFGDIADGKIVLNDFGRIVLEFWNGLTERFLEIELDAFVVMPNHIHGIILITGAVDANGVGAIHPGTARQGELPVLSNILSKRPGGKSSGGNRAAVRRGKVYYIQSQMTNAKWKKLQIRGGKRPNRENLQRLCKTP